MDNELIGIIPAGGIASRMGKLPCSKEVLPFPGKTGRPSVMSENLIRYYKLAGIQNLYFIIRNGKWDIPGYFMDGAEFNMNIAYLLVNLPFGTPFTINQAYPFIKNNLVALGFPDVIFKPENAFLQLKNQFLRTDSDIILGIVPNSNYLTSDMIEFNEQGKINNIIIKQNRPDLRFGWFIAIWRPSFSLYMKKYLADWLLKNPDGKVKLPDGTFREIYLGDIIRDSLKDGMQVDHLLFNEGFYKDLGTRDVWQNLNSLEGFQHPDRI